MVPLIDAGAVLAQDGKLSPAFAPVEEGDREGIAAPRLNATAEAGAMVVMDWKRTPGRPMAFARSFVGSGVVEDSTVIGFLLLYLS